MKTTWRRRFIQWIAKAIKHPEGMILPKWLLIIAYILHPGLAIIDRNPWFRVDFCNRIIIWRGIKISIDLLDSFTETTPDSLAYRIKRHGNRVIIERIIYKETP